MIDIINISNGPKIVEKKTVKAGHNASVTERTWDILKHYVPDDWMLADEFDLMLTYDKTGDTEDPKAFKEVSIPYTKKEKI
jgi:hypothetical protein